MLRFALVIILLLWVLVIVQPTFETFQGHFAIRSLSTGWTIQTTHDHRVIIIRDHQRWRDGALLRITGD